MCVRFILKCVYFGSAGHKVDNNNALVAVFNPYLDIEGTTDAYFCDIFLGSSFLDFEL